jgi:hypothetical protein
MAKTQLGKEIKMTREEQQEGRKQVFNQRPLQMH